MTTGQGSGAGTGAQDTTRPVVVPRQPVDPPGEITPEPSSAGGALPAIVQAPATDSGWSPTSWKRRSR